MDPDKLKLAMIATAAEDLAIGFEDLVAVNSVSELIGVVFSVLEVFTPAFCMNMIPGTLQVVKILVNFPTI